MTYVSGYVLTKELNRYSQAASTLNRFRCVFGIFLCVFYSLSTLKLKKLASKRYIFETGFVSGYRNRFSVDAALMGSKYSEGDFKTFKQVTKSNMDG